MKMRFTLLAFVPFLFISCGETEQSDTVVVVNDNDLISMPVFEESDDFVFIPPSPLEIAGFFRNAGLPYDVNALNPPSNMEKYQTKFKKAVNFGVYSADLATCVVHNQITDAQMYLEVIDHLADEIGMSNVFEENTIEKFKRNLDNKDSIVDILTEVQIKTMEYIETNGKDDLEAIYFAGAWMEGMYLGTLTLKEQDPEKIVQQLASQIELGNKIARGLEKIEDQDPEIEEIRYSILQIVNEYNTCESVLNLTEEDKDLGRIHLTRVELDRISGLIIELRNEMIQ